MTIIVGHRGAAGYTPENTLLSFKKAIEIGCSQTECDVRLSKDNEVIVIHDPSVERVSNGRGLVKGMTLNQIKKLRCPQNQHIPTLQEVMDVCKGKIDLQIELKAKGTPPLVNEIITRNGMVDRVVVISFQIGLLKEIKRLNSRLQACYLFQDYSRRVWEYAESIPVEIIGTRFNLVTKGMICHAHQWGKKVYAYHVNDKDVGQRLIGLGIDFIGTDFPTVFLKGREK